MKLKSILALAVCLFASAAFAAPVPELPTSFCTSNCSAAQQAIWADFQKGHGLQNAALPAFYSGECYHLSSSFDPAKTQYGALGFDHSPTNSSDFYQGGQFYYFYDSDPAAGMSLADAKAQGYFRFDNEKSKLIFQDNYAVVDYTVDPDVPWTYHLRTNASNPRELLVLAQWDHSYRIFCRLEQH